MLWIDKIYFIFIEFKIDYEIPSRLLARFDIQAGR